MNKEEFFIDAAKAALSSTSTDDEALACMIVMHTYAFHISPSVSLDDAGETTELSPLTRRHAAEIVAKAMEESSGSRCEPTYWYNTYDEQTPFEVASDIPSEWRCKVDGVMALIMQGGLVSGFRAD